MDVVLKMKRNGQVHRVLFTEAEITYEDVQQAIRSAHADAPFLVTRYYDDEQDLCTLSLETFSDFVKHAELKNDDAQRVLRLELTERVAPCAHSVGVDITSAVTTFVEPLLGLAKSWVVGSEHQETKKCKRRLVFLLVQLHKNKAFTAGAAAAVAVSSLPGGLAAASKQPDSFDQMAIRLFEMLPALQQALCVLVSDTEGLQQCVGKMAGLCAGGGSCSGAVLEFLTALSALTFKEQIAFVEALFARQGSAVTAQLATSWIPAMPLEHTGVTCDGCEKSDLQVLRFKCRQCRDYDLCGDCFAQKDNIHGGDCCNHEFDRIDLSPCKSWMPKHSWKGKEFLAGRWRTSGREATGRSTDAEHADLSFPVMVNNGRLLTLSWSRGDDPQQVAQAFALRHGILAQELPTILAFMDSVTAAHGDGTPVAGMGEEEDEEYEWQDALDDRKEDAHDGEKERKTTCQMESENEMSEWKEMEEAEEEVLKQAGGEQSDEEVEEDKQIGQEVDRERRREENGSGNGAILAEVVEDARYALAASQADPGLEEWRIIESIS